MTSHYKAVISPRADGHWTVEVWGERQPPRDVAYDLQLPSRQVARIVRTEKRARRVALRMIARCEKRYAAAYNRDSFTVTGQDQP